MISTYIFGIYQKLNMQESLSGPISDDQRGNRCEVPRETSTCSRLEIIWHLFVLKQPPASLPFCEIFLFGSICMEKVWVDNNIGFIHIIVPR